MNESKLIRYVLMLLLSSILLFLWNIFVHALQVKFCPEANSILSVFFLKSTTEYFYITVQQRSFSCCEDNVKHIDKYIHVYMYYSSTFWIHIFSGYWWWRVVDTDHSPSRDVPVLDLNSIDLWDLSEKDQIDDPP